MREVKSQHMTYPSNQQADQLIDEGHTLLMHGEWVEAVAKFDRAIAIGTQSGNAYFYKGQALSHLKRYTEARDAFQRALQINPNDGEAKRDLEYVLRHLK